MSLYLANSWSPVMWQHMLMLVAGNAVIGVLEGLVIARVFRVSYLRSISLMIVANYLSMWAGAIVFGIGETVSPIPDNVFSEPLNRIGFLLWISIAVAIGLSVIIEWPFCLAVLGKGPRLIARSILATLLAQAGSYTCIGLTHLRLDNTIGRDVQVVKAIDLDTNLARAVIYFVDPSDGDVYSIRLDGMQRSRAIEANLKQFHDVLAIAPIHDAELGPPWQLLACKHRGDSFTLIGEVAGTAAPFMEHPTIITRGWFLGFQGVADHRADADRGWQARPRGNSGIEFHNPQSGERFRVTYDTVFTSWWGRCPTMLPGNIAVFELGSQICVLDVASRQIAFLARGRSPVVVLRSAEM